MNETRPNHSPRMELKTEGIRLEDEYYTIEELAKLLKVHKNTIRNAIKDGRIKAEKFGQQWRIRKKDIQWKEGRIKYETRNKKWNNGSIERK